MGKGQPHNKVFDGRSGSGWCYRWGHQRAVSPSLVVKKFGISVNEATFFSRGLGFVSISPFWDYWTTRAAVM